jgi:hypothetical protein
MDKELMTKVEEVREKQRIKQNLKINFEDYIKQLMYTEGNFIYKNNLELLRKFYNRLFSMYEDEELCYEYLNFFTSIKDITISKIESNFSELILILDNGENKLIEYEYKSGLYFIFNDISNIIYIGKTNDLSTRPIQSFINKLPYDATYIKLYQTEEMDLLEAISIDCFLPLYNNKLESFPEIPYRVYYNKIEDIRKILLETEKIYPTII